MAWARSGEPDDPLGWLMTTARNAEIDILRREQRRSRLPDVGAATKKAAALGAKVVEDVHDTPNGIVSTILDPTGATLNLWQALPGA